MFSHEGFNDHTIALGAFDEKGFCLASNMVYAQMIGADIPGTIGNNWRNWTPKSEIETIERRQYLCLAGIPQCGRRAIQRADGGLLMTFADIIPLEVGRERIVIVTLRGLSADEKVPRGMDVASYVADLSAELAILCIRSGMSKIGRDLGMLSARAGHLAERYQSDPK